MLLLRLADVLNNEDEITRAFADDAATVVNDYVVAIPTLAKLFSEYEDISGLQLNIAKTIFIPLWPISSERGLRNLITELCPSWKDIKIAPKGKYLGFVIGPGGNGESWKGPISKYTARVRQWENTKCGLFWSTLYYNTFAVTTLEFVAQLEDITQDVFDAEARAMRTMAAGPGTWISSDDLESLGRYGIGKGFRQICHTSKASQLRVLHKMGERYIQNCAEEIRRAQLDTCHRPFGKWHKAAYASRLCNNLTLLASYGIRKEMILKQRKGNSEKSFQQTVRDIVVQKMINYSIEVRIRRKIRRWRFADAPAHVTNRIVIKFEAMRTAVSPAVCASFMRALWNGVPTSRRMASMKNFTQTNCVLNCSKTAADSIEHYCRCPVLRKCLKTDCDHMCINPLE